MSLPMAPRSADAHKGDFGRALIIGGSRGMAGAPALSGQAALHAGAGLVTVAVPAGSQSVAAGFHSCFMTVALAEDAAGRIGPGSLTALRPLLEKATSVAVGPGLGRSMFLNRFVLELYTRCPRPMVFDADALNALAEYKDNPPTPAGPRVLTPHVGEFRRLVGDSSLSAEQCRAAAPLLARGWNAVLVVKGPGTLITDGNRQSINTTGNPGMASGGSGDVLTGMVVSLLGQVADPFDAVVTAVFEHGRAGDCARDRLGEQRMTAWDIGRAVFDAGCPGRGDSAGADSQKGGGAS
ncbi:MAG: NAD(P)H-hydrate dehydratase [Planctomycetaceae bacterium]|nr:NAD(P)H-hydrate dehydratase [Planctomycetaceae bacterium]